MREVTRRIADDLERHRRAVARQDLDERAALEVTRRRERRQQRDAEPGDRRLDEEPEMISGHRAADDDRVLATRALELPGRRAAVEEDRVVPREVREHAWLASRVE